MNSTLSPCVQKIVHKTLDRFNFITSVTHQIIRGSLWEFGQNSRTLIAIADIEAIIE